MTRRSPYDSTAMLCAGLLLSLTVTAAPAHAGLLDKVKSIAPRLASGGLIKAIADYTGGILEEGTKLVKEGLSGNIDSATYSRRHDEFLDKKVHMGVKSFLKDAADNLKLKVSNPLAGLKDKLGDTRLSRAAISVKEKLWATTAEGAGTGVAKPDEQYGAIDPRIALDVQEEETEWYQAETGILDETPLPQEEVVAHVQEDRGQSPDSDWAAYGKGNEKGAPIRPDCENAWVDIDADCGNEDQATAQARDPWTDLDDGADEWADSSTPDCSGPWVDIDADCGDGYQGNDGRSAETRVAGLSDETQGGTYQEAVDRLLGNEPESDADPYSASDEGYEDAVAQLETEAAERERLARLAAEAAERERQAQLAAEAAERERQARLAAKRAERERKEREYYAELEQQRLEEELSPQRMQQDYNSSVLGQFNNMMNGIMGMAPTFPSGGVASRPSSNCQNLDQEVSRELNAMNLEGGGMCQNARTYIRVLSHVKERLSQYGCYNGEYEQAIQQARQTERAACNR